MNGSMLIETMLARCIFIDKIIVLGISNEESSLDELIKKNPNIKLISKYIPFSVLREDFLKQW